MCNFRPLALGLVLVSLAGVSWGEPCSTLAPSECSNVGCVNAAWLAICLTKALWKGIPAAKALPESRPVFSSLRNVASVRPRFNSHDHRVVLYCANAIHATKKLSPSRVALVRIS